MCVSQPLTRLPYSIIVWTAVKVAMVEAYASCPDYVLLYRTDIVHTDFLHIPSNQNAARSLRMISLTLPLHATIRHKCPRHV